MTDLSNSSSDAITALIGSTAATLPTGTSSDQTPAPPVSNTLGPQFGSLTGSSAGSAVAQMLNQFGLGSLTDWAMGQLKQGATPDEIALNIRQTPQWQQRFWMITARQKAGLTPISENDVINYESTASQLAQQFGMPRDFLDQHTIGQWIADDRSVVELEDVFKTGYDQVAKADPMVRAAFQIYFGPRSDQALAAFFVDPEKAEPALLQQAQAAVLGGNAARFGIGLNVTDAVKLAQAGVTLSTAESGFQDVNRLASLFQTDVGDKGPGLSKAQGVEARMLGNAGELDTEQQKLAARGATASGKVGVEENPQKGFEGLGASF